MKDINAVSVMKTNDQLEPTVFVIFGGAGDLTWRKLVPALFDLSQDRSVPAGDFLLQFVFQRAGLNLATPQG